MQKKTKLTGKYLKTVLKKLNPDLKICDGGI